MPFDYCQESAVPNMIVKIYMNAIVAKFTLPSKLYPRSHETEWLTDQSKVFEHLY